MLQSFLSCLKVADGHSISVLPLQAFKSKVMAKKSQSKAGSASDG